MFVLPFDHKTGLARALFGEVEVLSIDQIRQLKEVKQIVYNGFLSALDMGLDSRSSYILVDYEFGKDIIVDAKSKGLKVIVNVEQSGHDLLEFESGYQEYILGYKPDFVKVLVRFDSKHTSDFYSSQFEKLLELDKFCKSSGFKYIIEPIFVDCSISEQVEWIRLTHSHSIEPDVWKVRGADDVGYYTKLLEIICTPTEIRGEVGLIVLGSGEKSDVIFEWLEAAKGLSSNIIGFAIGRTFWLDDVKAYLASPTVESSLIASKSIAQHFYDAHRFFVK